MEKRRIAIIGTGGISHFHAAAFCAEKERCEIVALCDLFTEKCVALAQEYHLNSDTLTITDDYTTLLDRSDIDSVSICLPPSLHSEVTVAFLNHGKNVLCEKPMAASLAEADCMIDAEKKSGKLLGIISQNRFRDGAWKVKQMLSSGVLGKVLMTRVNSMWYRGMNYYNLWWRGTWEKEGGGCTLNHAVHQIDMLNWFIGMPKSLISVNMNVAHTNSEVEDCGMSILQYPHALAELNVSLNDMDEKQGFFFQCEHAEITVPWSVHCKKQLPNGFYEPDPESEKKFQKMYDHLEGVKGTEGHDALIKNYLDALEGKERLVVTSEDGRHALELIYSIYKSATTHHMVTLPMEESDDFYHKETLLKKVPHFYEKSVSIENAEGSISVGNMEKEK